MDIIAKVYCSIFGLLFGSLSNVLILRLPKKEDVIFKSSHCPKCSGTIKWYMNIPVFSFVFLKGKCFYCKEPISWQYPIVEICLGLAGFYLAPDKFALESWLLFIFYFFFFMGFLVHFLIDLRHQILPDSINILLLVLALAFSIYNYNWKHYVLGFSFGFGGTYLITLAFYKLKGQVGLGGGDIKLFGVLGILLGPVGIIQNIFVSCFMGSIIGLVLMGLKKMDRNTPLPFGPFIIITAMWQIYFSSSFAILMNSIFSFR